MPRLDFPMPRLDFPIAKEIGQRICQSGLDIRSFTQGNITFNPFQMTVRHLEWDFQHVFLRLEVLERDRGVPAILEIREEWTIPENDEEYLLRALELFLDNVVAHEMRELLLYRGRRRDPHV